MWASWKPFGRLLLSAVLRYKRGNEYFRHGLWLTVTYQKGVWHRYFEFIWIPTGKNYVRGVKNPACWTTWDIFIFVTTGSTTKCTLFQRKYWPICYRKKYYFLFQNCILWSQSRQSIKESSKQQLNNLFSVLVVDRHNRPCLLNGFPEPDNGISPKQRCMLALCRYLPFILNKLIKNKKESPAFIELIYLLQEIMDFAFFPRLTDSLLEHFYLLLVYSYFGLNICIQILP